MENNNTEKYYRQSNFSFISEVSLRVIRAFSYFFMVGTPLLNWGNFRTIIGTVLLCLGLVGISNWLLKKIRSQKRFN